MIDELQGARACACALLNIMATMFRTEDANMIPHQEGPYASSLLVNPCDHRLRPPTSRQPHSQNSTASNPQSASTMHVSLSATMDPRLLDPHRHRPPVSILRLNNSKGSDRAPSRARHQHHPLNLGVQLPHTRAAEIWTFHRPSPATYPDLQAGQ